MTLLSLLPIIAVTALLSSAFTLALAYLIARRFMTERAEQGIRLFIKRFREEVGPVIEERVKKGVRDGFSSLASREVLRDTTRNMAKSGVDFVGDTLKPLWRSRNRRPPFDTDES